MACCCIGSHPSPGTAAQQVLLHHRVVNHSINKGQNALLLLPQEKQGNLLVFMSTVGGVNELVQALQLALSHDPGCSILPLYAPLNDAEKTKVTSFDDLRKFPSNSGKRLICVATNIAEAGITIPGKRFRAILA